jgi:asparaginyl-tRNA synthetase
MSRGERTYIEDIARFQGEEITLMGWLVGRRSSGKVQFLTFRDGTGFIQIVVSRAEVSEEVWQDAKSLTQESSLSVRGRVRQDDRAPGGFELDLTGLKVIQIADEYPIAPKEHGTAFLLDHRHLWLRSRRQQAILKVRHEVISACRRFFDERDFVLGDTPIFTPNAVEGTTTLFETRYFDDTAYLTQSGQLYNEAVAMAVARTYCFGPTFRAEKSKTRRHLIEFWMVEPEVAFAELDDIVELGEDLICYVVASVLENRRRELEVLGRDISKLEAVEKPFVRMTYTEAVEFLQGKGLAIQWGGDFGGEDETVLGESHDRPVIVTRYPTAVKAFYMEPDPERPDLALCVDFIAPEGYGELIGGGQRIHDLELLRRRIREHQLPEEAFTWYLDLRRYGTVPHSGFGMGIERVIAWICKLDHLREAIPFPRMLYRLSP